MSFPNVKTLTQQASGCNLRSFFQLFLATYSAPQDPRMFSINVRLRPLLEWSAWRFTKVISMYRPPVALSVAVLSVMVIFLYIVSISGTTFELIAESQTSTPPIDSSSACSITPLEPITDVIAKKFENGENIDVEHLTPATKVALECLERAVTNAGGSVTLHSAYRPITYQNHLRDVWDKWQQIKHNVEPQCLQLRNVVAKEMQRHDIRERPALGNGPHARGIAFDANINVPSSVQKHFVLTDSMLKCHVRQPRPTAAGRHHYESYE
jgi:hypothetical protein